MILISNWSLKSFENFSKESRKLIETSTAPGTPDSRYVFTSGIIVDRVLVIFIYCRNCAKSFKFFIILVMAITTRSITEYSQTGSQNTMFLTFPTFHSKTFLLIHLKFLSGIVQWIPQSVLQAFFQKVYNKTQHKTKPMLQNAKESPQRFQSRF